MNKGVRVLCDFINSVRWLAAVVCLKRYESPTILLFWMTLCFDSFSKKPASLLQSYVKESHSFTTYWSLQQRLQLCPFRQWTLEIMLIFRSLSNQPFLSINVSFSSPNPSLHRTTTTRRRCTVRLSTDTLRWCSCCWRSWPTPPCATTSLRRRSTWLRSTAGWRWSSFCSALIPTCSAPTPRNTHLSTWRPATDTCPWWRCCWPPAWILTTR